MLYVEPDNDVPEPGARPTVGIVEQISDALLLVTMIRHFFSRGCRRSIVAFLKPLAFRSEIARRSW